jgi:hypothetical protein
MKPQTVKLMITESLGYCCEHKFFSLYPNNAVVAARLGVTTQSVGRHRMKPSICALCENVLAEKVDAKKGISDAAKTLLNQAWTTNPAAPPLPPTPGESDSPDNQDRAYVPPAVPS